ncbi:mitochondrial carrier domain-containing protein [Pestalotiopsis sp. NC0098]|nr:mitochondrial carrier domain-containing protein [Pestalotiopsis sp. NC0098]
MSISYATEAQRPGPIGEKVPVLQQKPAQLSPLISLVSGGVAGAVEASITYPFEFAKTRAQLGGTLNKTSNPLKAISEIVRQSGITSIYTGCSSLILGTTLKAGVRFLSFDYIKSLLAEDNGKLSPTNGILAGMLAGAVESVVAVTPTERIKTALIDQASNRNGGRCPSAFLATSLLIRERGVRELYRGLSSTTLKQSSTSAVRMGSYNALKNMAEKFSVPQNAGITFATGATAGVITVYMTQPFDTIKTRSQSAAGATTADAFRSVLADGGVRAFWKGSTMRLGRLIFSGGIVFTVYEKVSLALTRAQ